MRERRPNLREDPIPQLLCRLALPISIGMIFTALLHATDTFYASWDSVTSAAAVALAAPVVFILIVAGIGIGRATNAMVGRALGAGDLSRARHLALQAMSLAVLASIGIALPTAFWLPLVFGGIESGPLFDKAAIYTQTLLVAAPLFGMSVVAGAILNACGLPEAYRNAQLGAFLANIVLDPLFMYIFQMGVQGIALATVATQLGAVLYLVIKLIGIDFIASAHPKELLPKSSYFIDLLQQGLPTSASMIALAVSNVILIAFVTRFGTDALAGFGIVWRIEQVILIPLTALMQAVISVVSVNIGSGNFDRLRSTLFFSYLIASIFSFIMAVIIFIGSGLLVSIFSDVETVRMIGKDYLFILSFTIPSYAVIYVSAAAMQGLGRPALAFSYYVFRSILLTIALIYIALDYLETGLDGIWWSIFLANWFCAGLMWLHILVLTSGDLAAGALSAKDNR